MLREQIAKFISAKYKGIDWNYDYPQQKADALRETDQILALVQQEIDKVEIKESLFHISWGDGDNTFILAPDKKTAIENMGDGKGMINYVIDMKAMYRMIFESAREAIKKRIGE